MDRVLIDKELLKNKALDKTVVIKVHIDLNSIKSEVERLYVKCIDNRVDYAILTGTIADELRNLGIKVRKL